MSYSDDSHLHNPAGDHGTSISLPSEYDDDTPVIFDLRAFQARNNTYLPISPIDNVESDSEGRVTPTTPLETQPDDSPTTQHARNIPMPDIPNEASSVHTPEKVKPPSRSSHLAIFSTWWWWWEIGAILMCVICIGLVITVLQKIENQPIDLWPYAIRPNSLISVLTTIAKAAMMIPITSCLSQAKWYHFQRRPHALDHLQVYDDASRGPWGSLLLLFSVRLKAVAALALALVTLVALGIEPSVQQILEPRTRQAPLANVTAQIGRAENYTSRAIWSQSFHSYGGPRNPNPNILKFQTAIANGLVGSVSDVNFYCPEPATQCTWEQFHTLAVCADYRNVTGEVSETHINRTLDNYSFPEGPDITMVKTGSWGMSLFHSLGRANNAYNGTVLNGALFGTGKENSTAFENSQMQFFSIKLNWCLRTYEKVIASPAGIREAPYTSKPLYHYDFSETDTIAGAGIFVYEPYQADSVPGLFNISVSLRDGLWLFVNELFSRELHSPLTDDEAHESDAKFAEFLYGTDLANFTRNIEETLTNQIRSSSQGDNEKAIMFPGQAFYQETYWHVEWPWITVIIAEAFLTLLLLITSIVVNWDQPLFRSSALALLFHGLQESDLDLQSYTKANPEKLERLAKSVYVEFRENENGVLKFVRAVKGEGDVV